jgi:hypothetical protein
MIADINLGTQAGVRFNVAASGGAIARAATADTLTGGGTVTSPVVIRGYSGTTPGDGNQGRTNGSGALVTTNMPSLTYTTAALTTGAWTILESMNVTGAPSGPLVTEGADGSVKGCVVNNSSTNAAAIGLTTGGLRATVFDNDITLSGGAGGTAAISAPNSPTARQTASTSSRAAPTSNSCAATASPTTRDSASTVSVPQTPSGPHTTGWTGTRLATRTLQRIGSPPPATATTPRASCKPLSTSRRQAMTTDWRLAHRASARVGCLIWTSVRFSSRPRAA